MFFLSVGNVVWGSRLHAMRIAPACSRTFSCGQLMPTIHMRMPMTLILASIEYSECWKICQSSSRK
eukprot:1548582-Pyramimonas_sp.AAC.1